LEQALQLLAGSAYGQRIPAGVDLEAAQRGVAETLLWHLRIMAGWLPTAGAGLVRALAGWFELANVDARLAALAGDGGEPAPFVRGGLATAWTVIERAHDIEGVAHGLSSSP
jgi:hypothetical protein